MTEKGLASGNGNVWHLHLHQGGHSLGLDVSSLLLEKKFETSLQSQISDSRLHFSISVPKPRERSYFHIHISWNLRQLPDN